MVSDLGRFQKIEDDGEKHIRSILSLRSWRDLVRECFCFGSEAVNASGEAVRGLVKSRVEFPPAQISGVF